MLAHPARLGLLALVATAILASQFGVITAGPDEAIFDRGVLNLTIDEPTSLTFGPDGRLYIASQAEIIAVTLDAATHGVLAIEPIAIGLVVTLPAAPIGIPIPGIIDPGMTFGLQALTLTAPTGNLSGPYDLLIR